MGRLWIVTLLALVAGAAHAAEECKPSRCDVNGDGIYGDHSDHLAFFASLGTSYGESRFSVRADFDGDKAVTSEDFAVFLSFCPIGRK